MLGCNACPKLVKCYESAMSCSWFVPHSLVSVSFSDHLNCSVFKASLAFQFKDAESFCSENGPPLSLSAFFLLNLGNYRSLVTIFANVAV